MAWRISPPLSEILSKGGDNACITRDEELTLLRRDLYSRETYALMETANRLSRDQFNGKGENHFHIGIMRRINFPGSPMERYGMISELEMARMVAASRLVMADIPRAQCTHEPHAVSLMAGANLFFPEMGSSPRDGKSDTGKGRGTSIASSRQMFKEMGWDPDVPSNCFGLGKALVRQTPRGT